MRQMRNRRERILRALSDSDVLLVEPGYFVEQRTIYGPHGEQSDMAISLQWRDAEGCLWACDFLEEDLANAQVARNRILLKDSEGAPVRIKVHRLKPWNI